VLVTDTMTDIATAEELSPDAAAWRPGAKEGGGDDA